MSGLGFHLLVSTSISADRGRFPWCCGRAGFRARPAGRCSVGRRVTRPRPIGLAGFSWPAAALRRVVRRGRGGAVQVFLPEWLVIICRRPGVGRLLANLVPVRPARGFGRRVVPDDLGVGPARFVVADFERDPPRIGQLDRALLHPPPPRRAPLDADDERPGRPARASGLRGKTKTPSPQAGQRSAW